MPIGRPGDFPYTRGIHETMYRGRVWTMRQFAGFGTAHETNALQQVYRNINTGTHHAMLDLDTTLEVQGKVLLGVDQPDAMI